MKWLSITLVGVMLTGCGFSQKVLHKSKEPRWPEASPIDKTDPYWEFNNNLNVNGVQFKKVEVSPGKWQWVVDEAAMKSLHDQAEFRARLFADLSKRKLSHKELAYVDVNINTPNWPNTYFAVDKYAELYDSLVKQWELQKGRKMEGYRPLSTAKGEFNRSPQEADSKRAVEDLIRELQEMTK